MTPETITLAEFNRLTEKAWLGQIVQLAKTLGWKCYHPFLSIHSERGFPDLTLVRERVVFVELKTEKGKLSPHQVNWVDSLRMAGAEVRVWRPSNWDEAVKILSKRIQ